MKSKLTIRQERQTKILQLVGEKHIETQEELMTLLSEAGLSVTQATVSRDIQELGLAKSATKGTRPHYIKPLDPKLAKLKTLFHQSVLSIEGADHFVVIKTITGGANSACIIIDRLSMPEVMGTIAGDDTILVILREAGARESVMRRLEALLD